MCYSSHTRIPKPWPLWITRHSFIWNYIGSIGICMRLRTANLCFFHIHSSWSVVKDSFFHPFSCAHGSDLLFALTFKEDPSNSNFWDYRYHILCTLKMCKNTLTERLFLLTKTWDLVQSPPNFAQVLGDETDFTKPNTIRGIERFLVNCSEAVSKVYSRYGSLETSFFRPYLIQ